MGKEAVHACMALFVSADCPWLWWRVQLQPRVRQRCDTGDSTFSCTCMRLRLCRVAWSVRATSTGSWTAHILAGTALLLWALHWNQAIFRGWLTQGRTQRPFRSHATYPVPFLPERWPVEALAKVVLPLVAILVNLVGSSGWRSNTCGEGTPREGHFDPENIYRYANVWVLFSVLASGERLDKACCRHDCMCVARSPTLVWCISWLRRPCGLAGLLRGAARRHRVILHCSSLHAAGAVAGRRIPVGEQAGTRQNVLLLLHADSQHCR